MKGEIDSSERDLETAIQVISDNAKGWYEIPVRLNMRSQEPDPDGLDQFLKVIDSELVRL